MQAFPFPAQHQPNRYRQIHLGKSALAVGIQPHQPAAHFFELLHRPAQVHHPRYADVLGCARRYFFRRRGHAHRPPQGQNHSVSPGANRRAQDGAQIARVFHPVQEHKQRRRLGGTQEFFQIQVTLRARHRRHTLMSARAGQTIKLAALHEAHWNARRPRRLHQLLHLAPAAPARHQQLLQPTSGRSR